MTRCIKLVLIISAALLEPACSSAWSDAQSYCDVYAQDYAASHHSQAVSSQTLYTNAHKDCLAAYGQAPRQENDTETSPAVPAKETVGADLKNELEKTSPTQDKGVQKTSENWKKRCAARYASFNPKTGSYRSRSGKWRNCPYRP